MTPLSFVRKAFIRLQLPAILWALLIFIGSSIPAKDFPNLSIFSYDKVFHFVLFGLLCFFIYRAFANQARFPSLAAQPLLASLLLCLAYGIIDELHQTFVPGRAPDPMDWLADSLGALTVVAGLLIVSRVRSKRA